jgi:hypothetical protein
MVWLMMLGKHGSYAISKKIGVKWPLNIDFSKWMGQVKMFKWWCNFCKSYLIYFLFLKMETWPSHFQKSMINRHFTPIFHRNCVWANFNIQGSWDLRLLILCLGAGDLPRPVRLHSWHNFALESFRQTNGNVL